jgi:hypothetical protein
MLVDGGLESARPWVFNPAESQFKLLILNGNMVVARDATEYSFANAHANATFTKIGHKM